MYLDILRYDLRFSILKYNPSIVFSYWIKGESFNLNRQRWIDEITKLHIENELLEKNEMEYNNNTNNNTNNNNNNNNNNKIRSNSCNW